MNQVTQHHAGLNRSSGLTPTIYMKRLLEVAADHGVETDIILKRIGMDREALENSDMYYTIEQHFESLRAIREIVDIPALGLLVGLRTSIADLGIMGYAMLSSPTLRKAMDVAIRFQRITDPVLHIRCGLDGNDVVITIEPLMLLSEAYRYDVEVTLAIWRQILKFYFGDRARINQIRVTWPEQSYVAKYKEVFECPVHFSQDTNELRFPVSYLDEELSLANEQAARICEQQCAELLRKLSKGETILDTVRRIMINTSGRFPDLEEVADKLHTTPRNLRRRLADANTSFRKISEEVRMHFAMQYLTDTTLSIEQVALLVGYSEASNFHRAFKKHVGMTPKNFRISS